MILLYIHQNKDKIVVNFLGEIIINLIALLVLVFAFLFAHGFLIDMKPFYCWHKINPYLCILCSVSSWDMNSMMFIYSDHLKNPNSDVWALKCGSFWVCKVWKEYGFAWINEIIVVADCLPNLDCCEKETRSPAWIFFYNSTKGLKISDLRVL